MKHMMSSLEFFQVMITLSVFSVATCSSLAHPEVSRRFIVDQLILSCEECYHCVCQNKWEECGLWPHDWVRKGCPEHIDDSEDCKAPFRQHGGWTTWTSWGHCRGECGNQHHVRTRSCSKPSPKNCGEDCTGPATDRTSCSTHACNAHAQTSTTFLPSTTTTTTTTTATTTRKTTTTMRPTTSTTSTTTIQSTQGTTPSVVSHCDKFCTVASVAQHHQATESEASLCQNGKHGGSEALIMQCCHVNGTASWKRGLNVLVNCKYLPSYIPVAEFDGKTYKPGTAGVFIGCLTNGETGFQFIRQTCNSQPEIIHVSTDNPNFANEVIKYYAILQ